MKSENKHSYHKYVQKTLNILLDKTTNESKIDTGRALRSTTSEELCSGRM